LTTWITYSQRAWLPRSKPAPTPTEAETAVLSHFTDKEMAQEPIEPLCGIARHPFAKVGCQNSMFNESIFDIEYLVLHNNCGSTASKPRTILYDMGASVGFKGVPGGIYSTPPRVGGGLAPSVPLLYRLYTDRCLEPDLVFAWEPNPRVTRDEFFGELPQSIREKVHFYQDYVTDEVFQQRLKHPMSKYNKTAALTKTAALIASSETKYKRMAVSKTTTLLKELVNLAKPEDFVVVKLDIDTPEVEHVMVQTIAENPEVAALIDEMFFEYHFYFDGLDFGWGTKVAGNVDTALGLMHRLRTLGIRAHFWI